jgi:hypothetical protein
VPGEQAVLSAEAMTELLELACSARTMPWPWTAQLAGYRETTAPLTKRRGRTGHRAPKLRADHNDALSSSSCLVAGLQTKSFPLFTGVM